MTSLNIRDTVPVQNDEDKNKQNRKSAQRYLLAEHLFNTLADRMWLYAAGLLLMEAISRINPDISQITISSTYGLVLSLVKVSLSPSIGSLVEKCSRIKGALIPLLVQNTSVAISAVILTLILMPDGLANLSVEAVFTIVTFFSCIAVLASIGLQNVISRDWAVEIATTEELTFLNAWLRAIDQGTLVLSAGISGFTIAGDPAIGAIVIAAFNILSMFGQGFCLYRIYQLVPGLAIKPEKEIIVSDTLCETVKNKFSFFISGWVLLAKSPVFVPGFCLGILYINILGMGLPLQGYARESCLSEATISILYIVSAVTGFIAPLSFPFLIKTFGLISTGLAAGVWQIGFIGLASAAIFFPGSPYMYFQPNQECIFSEIDNSTEILDNFWIRCPAGVTPPESYVSIATIFASAIFQRFSVFLFDMTTTQQFQLDVDVDKRNRVAAGQYSLNAIFGVGMYALSLIWSSSCEYGTAILFSNFIIIGGYCLYIVWSCTIISVETKDGMSIRVPRLKAYKFNKKSSQNDEKKGETKNEISEL